MATRAPRPATTLGLAVKSPHCPRLATHITELRRVYRHLDKATIRRLITDHTTLGCPTCAGYEVPRWLARDPRDDPRTTQEDQ